VERKENQRRKEEEKKENMRRKEEEKKIKEESPDMLKIFDIFSNFFSFVAIP
jgi:hypothetical protein